MMFVMLVVGIGLVLAGLLAIGFGISIKEFSCLLYTSDAADD